MPCRNETNTVERPGNSLVVSEAQLVALLPSIDDPLLVQVEQVGVVVAIIDLATAVSLSLIDELPSVLAQQLPLLGILLRKPYGLWTISGWLDIHS